MKIKETIIFKIASKQNTSIILTKKVQNLYSVQFLKMIEIEENPNKWKDVKFMGPNT